MANSLRGKLNYRLMAAVGEITCQPISLFPTRLRPIIFLCWRKLIIVDFVNGLLISVNGSILPKIVEFSWNTVEIDRKDDKIYINVIHAGYFTCSLVIDLSRVTLTLLSQESSLENKQIISVYNGDRVQEIKFEDGVTFDCVERWWLSTTKDGVKNKGIYMKSVGIPRLLKLHSRTNDPDGFYKYYFCWFDRSQLLIGTVHDNKFHTKEIINSLFENIYQFGLMEDNVLMLVTARCYMGDYSQQLVFIDCNEVRIVDCIELDHHISNPVVPHYAFDELVPIRKDFLTLQTRFVSSMGDCLLRPLVDIVFFYLFGNVPSG
ncbi:MAG: hypothetical protein Harvfovirus22_5 [Harvfovirus sp.]|uniref:Uncharacterized protein n=1 Tax=Harvfovirus sp. TaxID=2487768 RepID=A0A3G5A276_9VIRU|nr:MAG: hypothetical protein Harvfovirus22_5 [Harvfovirus sp.]